MVEGNEIPTEPGYDAPDIPSQPQVVRLNQVKGTQRRGAKGHDKARGDDRDLGAQVLPTMRQLVRRWAAVSSQRVLGIAQHGIGNEHFRARPSCTRQQVLKRAPGLITAQWNAGSLGAQTPGGLGNKHHRGARRPVAPAKDTATSFHRRTAAASLDKLHQTIEFLLVRGHR